MVGDTDTPISEILRTVHENTWRKTVVSIGETFKADKFPEADFEVHPQMAESPNFYKGGHQVASIENDSSVLGNKSKVGVNKTRSQMTKQPMYKKDKKFTFPTEDNSPEEPSISAESLTDKINEEKETLGTLGIVAQAGAGKTTSMRRWARKTMNLSGMTTENRYTPSDTSRFQMVHFLDMRCIRFSEETTLREILFKDVFEDEKEKKNAYNWLIKNQSKVVIFLDGLDQAEKDITDDDSRYIGLYDVASSANILFNLLSRKLLRGVRLVISSREHAAASLPDEARFDDVITLTGFSEEDAKRLFNAVTDVPMQRKASTSTGDDQDKGTAGNPQLSNWDILAKNSSALLPFISTPAFLMFTAIVFNYDGTAPTSLTALLAKVVDTLQYSLNIHERKRIWKIIHKLKRLSHKGMESNLVMFSEEDLNNCGLNVEDIRDLLLMVPRSRSLSHHLIKGDNVFFFCHQILQEFLSACYVVEMELPEFTKFVEAELNEDHWSVVRRFVCGLIFVVLQNEKLIQISHRQKKEQILRKSLIAHIEKAWSYQFFELYAAIYESNDEQLIMSTNFTLGSTDCSMVRLVSALLAKGRDLDASTLNSVGLNRNMLEGFVRKRKYVQSQVKYGDYEDGRATFFDIRNGAMEGDTFLQTVANSTVANALHIRFVMDKIQPALGPNYQSPPHYLSSFNQEDQLDITIKRPDWSFIFYDVEKECRRLNPKSVTIRGDQIRLATQYISYSQFDVMKSWQVYVEVDELILNSLSFGHQSKGESQQELRYCHDISYLIEQFRVKMVNIAISPKDIDTIPPLLKKCLPHLLPHLKVHVVAVARDKDDLQELSLQLQGHQVEHLRLFIERAYYAREIKHFMHALKDVHLWIHYRIPGTIDEQYLQEVAEGCGIALIVYRYQGVPHDDPWIWVETGRAVKILKAQKMS